jgi:dephospho-CoA kinase
MTYNKQTKIIALVGVTGSGKSTAIDYLTNKGYPKADGENILDEIQHLVTSGQQHIVTDHLYDIPGFERLRQEYHSEIVLIALVVPKHIRYHRLEINAEHPESHLVANDQDTQEIETDKAELIGLADYYIINDGDIEKLHRNIDAVLQSIDFYES